HREVSAQLSEQTPRISLHPKVSSVCALDVHPRAPLVGRLRRELTVAHEHDVVARWTCRDERIDEVLGIVPDTRSVRGAGRDLDGELHRRKCLAYPLSYDVQRRVIPPTSGRRGRLREPS